MMDHAHFDHALKPQRTPDSGDRPLLCDVVPDVARRRGAAPNAPTEANMASHSARNQ